LRAALEAAIPVLDPDRAVPARPGDEREREAPAARVAGFGILAALALATGLLAGPGDQPGLGLALALVAIPGLIAARVPAGLAPVLSVPLGVVGLAAAFAALAATLGGSARERATIAVAGWWALLAGGAAIDADPGVAVLGRLPDHWQGSFEIASGGLLSPLLEPPALIGALAFGVAAAVLGWILRAEHLAIVVLGALLWAAGLEAAMRLVDRGDLSGRPALLAGAALIVVAAEARRRGATLPGLPSLGRAPVPAGSGRH
jgi:hypothetical protein